MAKLKFKSVWSPLSKDWLKVNFAGLYPNSRENANIGSVVKDDFGHPLVSRTKRTKSWDLIAENHVALRCQVSYFS